VINLSAKASKPDWDAFLPAKAPEGAPNLLVVLFDDTGQAAWGAVIRVRQPPPVGVLAHCRACV